RRSAVQALVAAHFRCHSRGAIQIMTHAKGNQGRRRESFRITPQGLVHPNRSGGTEAAKTRGMSSLRRRDAGFTFIELLVVLLIGSALYAVALGPVRSYLEGKKRAGCAENLR